MWYGIRINRARCCISVPNPPVSIVHIHLLAFVRFVVCSCLVVLDCQRWWYRYTRLIAFVIGVPPNLWTNHMLGVFSLYLWARGDSTDWFRSHVSLVIFFQPSSFFLRGLVWWLCRSMLFCCCAYYFVQMERNKIKPRSIMHIRRHNNDGV